MQTVPRKLWLDKDGKQLRQWPIEEIETLRRKRVGLRRDTMLNAGAMNEIVGVAGSQADVEVAFKIPSLEGAEALDPNWLLDPQKLCGEKGASVPGGVGPFGLIVMASGDLQEHTAVFFRVFRHHDDYKLLMCTDLTKSSTRAGVYKPPYGGFVDIDIKEHKVIKLRTLVSSAASLMICFFSKMRKRKLTDTINRNRLIIRWWRATALRGGPASRRGCTPSTHRRATATCSCSTTGRAR
jgi:beta-fructofuranosidase